MLTSMSRAAVFALAVLVMPAFAEAGWRRDGGDGVVAESRYGNGTVSGPVREGRHGLEVRLPGGTWVGCRRSCSETLRVETVDFWENDGRLVGAGTASNECGVFGCLGTKFRY